VSGVRDGAGGAAPGGMSPDTALAVRPLTVVPEGDEFLVGDPETATYVVLPAEGVAVLDLLRSGLTIAEAAAEGGGGGGKEIDVADFAEALLELGFAAVADGAAVAEDTPVEAPPRWARALYSRAAWTLYAASAGAVLALFALRPGLLPHASDIFFLDTPVRSLAALTAMTYVLAAAHEACHWLAARAVGVRSRITVSRRLYFLVLEIDLTGLWSLPRRRRYGALLAGMAFDATVLAPILLARYGAAEGWWSLGDGAARVLAALTFVEFAALVSQFWVFARTDVYALLVTATGSVNLFRVNQLLVRRTLRRLSPDQERELADAHPRDVQVARWFRWIHVLGLAAAAVFFVAYFLPATVRLVGWLAGSVVHAGPASEHFWEALVFGALILSPRALTLAVALRDLRAWRGRRAASA
jgi:putative peptide zinc metalloprotease protein